MKRKKVLALCLATAMTASMLAGCGSDGGGSKESSSSASEQSSAEESSTEEKSSEEGGSEAESGEESGSEEGGTSGNVVAFEDIEFPDAMPANPTQADQSWYGYDDMSVHYDLEFMTTDNGEALPSFDPIKAWLEEKFNVTLTISPYSSTSDLETAISTRFQSNDIPDLFQLPSRDYAFTLGEQGLLVDGKDMYPYMPQTCKFVTKTLLSYSTMDDGTIPFVTKYSIQDSDIWGLAIRKDWLANLEMEMPTTLDELKEYAKACTFNDPDGNGQDDTWFMTGAGSGTSFQSLAGFQPWFGNPAAHAEGGKLVSPMLDGSTRGWLEFLNELYTMNVLAPDWFTIDWQTSKSYTLQDKVGMVWYPSQNLYLEYSQAQANDWGKAADVWEFLPSLPDNAKGSAGGSCGFMWAVPKSNVDGDQGKLMRILHMLDAFCYGGDSYFATVQGGSNEVHEGYDGDVREYLPDGTSYCYVSPDHPGFNGTYGTTNLSLTAWQCLGYTLKWQMEYVTDDMDEGEKRAKEMVNEGIKTLASYDRWPNDSLLSSVNESELAPNLKDWLVQQQYQFVTGARSFDDWDNFIKEWLDQGARAVLTAQAEKLGVELPDEAK